MKKDMLKNNFYEAVNHDWLKEAVIPGDQPSISAFMELHLGIEKTLMDLTNKWNDNNKDLPKTLKEYIKYYQMTKDFEQREKLGAKPIKFVLDKINNLNSLKDLENNFKELTYMGFELPFSFMVMQDFLNSENQVMYFGSASLFLPDTSYYHNEESKAQLLGLFRQTTTQLLSLYGYGLEEGSKLLEEALKFDELLVPITPSSVERADYTKLYNPLTKEEVNNKKLNFDLMNTANLLVNQDVSKLICTRLAFIDEFNNIINEDNWPLIKSWIIISNLIGFASNLNEDIRVASSAFNRALSGIKEPQNKEKAAFYKAYNKFGQIVGLYYGETYFGEKAKEDVKHMVFEMIDIYKEQIKNNAWLKEETKGKALKKLSTLSVEIGYPDELPKYFDKVSINGYDNDNNLLLEEIKFSQLMNQEHYNKYNQSPNKKIWGMPASMVNAYYNPQNNQIVFPAAILQKPYYSLEQSPSENYGGIGAVIAHEISHAFDNNGAKFDETGSLADWWTEDDLKAFKEKTDEMIKLFDGVETGHGQCNGTLTVSENIADSGGLRAALLASMKNKDHDFEKFFINWARVWRQKSSAEYAKLLLTVDVHGPSILRANLQLSNLEEFQEFYKLTKEDKMYLPKDKMVTIW